MQALECASECTTTHLNPQTFLGGGGGRPSEWFPTRDGGPDLECSHTGALVIPNSRYTTDKWWCFLNLTGWPCSCTLFCI